MVIMNDVSLTSLIRRCQEKEKQGYDYVTPIKKQKKIFSNYVCDEYKNKSFKFKGVEMNTLYSVAMKKIN